VRIQVLTNINGRPLDDPAFFPIFERISNRYSLPVWMRHRISRIIRSRQNPNMKAGSCWDGLTNPAWRWLVSEMFDRLPKLRFVTHHCGSTIPLLLGRVGPMWDGLGLRENDERNMAIRACMAQRSKRPIDYFRDFFHRRRRQ
jgi:uncharacterized protein